MSSILCMGQQSYKLPPLKMVKSSRNIVHLMLEYNIFISSNRRDTILIHKMGKEVYRHVCIYWSKKMPFCCRRRRSAMQVLKTSHKKSQGPIWYLRKQANVITVSCSPYMYCMVCFRTHKYSRFWFKKMYSCHVQLLFCYNIVFNTSYIQCKSTPLLPNSCLFY